MKDWGRDELNALLDRIKAAIPDDAVSVLLGDLRQCEVDLLLRAQNGRPANDDELLTAEDVGRWLGTDARWAQRHAKELGVIHIGRHLRFSRAGVRRYLARQKP